MPRTVPEGLRDAPPPPPSPLRARRRLLRWFAAHDRGFFWREGPGRPRLTRFQALLVEFLLWKTSAARSESVIRKLCSRYPHPAAVLARRRADLEREIRPLGLFRRRAACLLALSRQLVERHGSAVPRGVAVLQELTGIGQYAARATACVLDGSRLMPVDANAARVFGRVFGLEGPRLRSPGPAWDLRLAAFVPRREPRRFLWAVMDLAALVCRRREPACGTCPMNADCVTGGARLRAAAVSRAAPARPPRAPAPTGGSRRAAGASRS